MFKKAWAWLVTQIIRPRWIVMLPDPTDPESEAGDMGVRILGVNFFYYKYPDPTGYCCPWRLAEKREFGEVVRSHYVDAEK
jgi:hypothetical protein